MFGINIEEGIFHARAYIADGKDTFDFSKAFLLIDSGMNLAKGNKIKRKAYHSWEEGTELSNGVTLNKTIEKIRNKYIINFNIGLVFSYSPDSSIIRERSIPNLILTRYIPTRSASHQINRFNYRNKSYRPFQ
jgi:hypothetical protein